MAASHLYALIPTTYTINKYESSGMSLLDTSDALATTPWYIYAYEDYLYIGDNSAVYKYSATTFALIGSVALQHRTISMVSDGTYLYAAGLYNYAYKIAIADMSIVDSYAASGQVGSVAFDGTYLYAGVNGGYVHKIDTSNMSSIDQSDLYGSNAAMNALVIVGDYIYVGGSVTQKVYKYELSTLNKVAESPAYGGEIWYLTADESNIYVSSKYDHVPYKKYQASNLALVAESSNDSYSTNAMHCDGEYLYTTISGGYYITKRHLSTLSVVANSPSAESYVISFAILPIPLELTAVQEDADIRLDWAW